jgi:hypothetical protein
MRALSNASSAVRHTLEVSTQALLIAAILAAILLALSPIYRPANVLVGSGRASAGHALTGNSITVVGASDAARVAVAYGSEVTTYSTMGRDYFYLFVRVQCWADTTKL